MPNIKNENKIEHLWTILCSLSSIDNETNNVSLFNIIEEVAVSPQTTQGKDLGINDKKGILLPFEIISLWKRLNDTESIISDVKISFLDPNNNLMQNMGYKMEIKPQHQRMRMRVKANGITVTKQGEYFFLVEIKENTESKFREVARIPLLVKMPTPTDLKVLKK